MMEELEKKRMERAEWKSADHILEVLPHILPDKKGESPEYIQWSFSDWWFEVFYRKYTEWHTGYFARYLHRSIRPEYALTGLLIKLVENGHITKEPPIT